MLDNNKLNELNRIIKEYIDCELTLNNKISLGCLEYTEQLLNIFNDNMPDLLVKSCEEDIALEDSINNAKDFMYSLGDRYGKYLENRLNDGTINFISKDEANKKDIEDSSSGYENGKRDIVIIYENNFGDAYTIIHEIFHDLNTLLPEYYNEENYYLYEGRDALTETVSFMATTIARNYFCMKYPNIKDIDTELYRDYGDLYYKCYELDFAINLVKLYDKKRNISNDDIDYILKNESADYNEAVDELIDGIFKEEDLGIFYNERYLTAIMLSNYIMNNFSNPKEILLILNDMITNMPLEKVFEYLGLNINLDLDNGVIKLDEDSVKQIEDSFKQQVKKIY